MSRTRGPTITRRAVVAGAMSLPLAGMAEPVAATSPSETDELGLRLKRLARRCKRLHARMLDLGDQCARIGRERDVPASLPDGRRNPRYDDLLRELGYDAAWKNWSNQLGEALAVAAVIRRAPAATMDDLDIKFGALLFEILHDQRVDPELVRMLREFERDLRRATGR